jgi:ectoine hydrolase
MAWLSGYDGWSFYTHQCLIVQHDAEPIWWGRGIDAPGAVRTTYLDHENILKYPDHFVQSDACHPMDHLSGLLRELKLDRGSVGVEMENYYFSAAAFRSLQTNLPHATLIDATALVNWQRIIKSDQELDYMRSAARIVENMHARIYEIIEPGLAKNQLAAEIFHSGIAGKDEHWGDYPAIMPLLPTGMDATAAHLTWDDSKLKTQARRHYFLRNRRLPSALPLPVVAHDFAGDATAKVSRCRTGGARRDACRTRKRAPRQTL